MSDPVINADIEDVLSSIRRLVSDEPLGNRVPLDGATPQPVERFVLTPALRVLEDDGPSAETEKTPPAAIAADATDAVGNAHLGDQEPDPQISQEFQSDSEWRETEAAAHQPHTNVTPQTDEAPDQPSEDISTTTNTAPGAQSLEERFAELEAAIEQAPQEWEPDGSEDGSSDETRPLSFDTDDTVADITNVLQLNAGDGAADEAVAETELPIDETTTDAAISAETNDGALDVAVEELMTAATPQSDDTESEPDADTAATGTSARDWQDIETELQDPAPDHAVEEAPVREEASKLSEDAVDDPPLADPADETENILSDEAATLDEDALREMVSDLVRQELQGVLGERITRNVRRLVRREIQRAMAMRDLE